MYTHKLIYAPDHSPGHNQLLIKEDMHNDRNIAFTCVSQLVTDFSKLVKSTDGQSLYIYMKIIFSKPIERKKKHQ